MNPEVKILWLEALRSGRYKQTCHQLRNAEGFCCLGVLCDISGLGQWDQNGYYRRNLSGLHSDLPSFVAEWAGLPSNPLASDGTPLADLNDLAGLTFPQIAGIIERDL